MRIYTRTGDDGTTGLFGGRRIGKDDLRIEAYGTVDELNAWLGKVATHDVAEPAREHLQTMQNEMEGAVGSSQEPATDSLVGSAPAGIQPQSITSPSQAYLYGPLDRSSGH